MAPVVNRGGRQRRHCCSAAVVLLALTCGSCFCYALIRACSVLCCGTYPAPFIHTTGLRRSDLRVSGSGVALADQHTGLQYNTWWRWRRSTKLQGSTLEALALKAKDAAKKAMEQELVAQAKVKAALERQARKHKALVKQLEAQGWRLSVSDKASRGSLRKSREQFEALLRSEEYAKQRSTRHAQMNGRGIVLAAGGPVPLANAYITLHMLRKVYNCSLPIEIYYNGPYELDSMTQKAFEAEFSSLRCINIADCKLPKQHDWAQAGHALSRQQSGWVLKALMLYLTSFAEVLVLDADNLPLADPSFLFESPEYVSSGSLFWPDFWSNNWHNPGPVYDLLNLTEPWEKEPDLLTTESGQFLLNRVRHDRVLEWVMFLNLHADMLYAVIWGDKDTYRLAFSLAGEESMFSQVTQRAANALHAPFLQPEPSPYNNMKGEVSKVDTENKFYTHAGMLQMAPTGGMLFLHRTAGSKLDPHLEYPAGYMPVQFLTPPLTPRQAAQVHITGEMFISKFDAEKTAACTAPDGLDLAAAAKKCGMLDSVVKGLESISVSKSFPIPLFRVEDFAGLPFLLESSMDAFRKVQQQYRTNRVLLGRPQQT